MKNNLNESFGKFRKRSKSDKIPKQQLLHHNISESSILTKKSVPIIKNYKFICRKNTSMIQMPKRIINSLLIRIHKIQNGSLNSINSANLMFHALEKSRSIMEDSKLKNNNIITGTRIKNLKNNNISYICDSTVNYNTSNLSSNNFMNITTINFSHDLKKGISPPKQSYSYLYKNKQSYNYGNSTNKNGKNSFILFHNNKIRKDLKNKFRLKQVNSCDLSLKKLYGNQDLDSEFTNKNLKLIHNMSKSEKENEKNQKSTKNKNNNFDSNTKIFMALIPRKKISMKFKSKSFIDFLNEKNKETLQIQVKNDNYIKDNKNYTKDNKLKSLKLFSDKYERAKENFNNILFDEYMDFKQKKPRLEGFIGEFSNKNFVEKLARAKGLIDK